LKRYLRDYLFLFAIAGAIVALDQITKSIVRANLTIGEMWVPWEWLEPYARIVHWKNTGAAFGMGQGLSEVFKYLAVLVSAAIVIYFPQVPRQDWPLRYAMSLQLGGAVGNLIDRLTIGHVTDFISVGNFAVFNVADSSISIGVAVLLVGIWIMERRQPAEPPEVEKPENPDSPPEPPALSDARLASDDERGYTPRLAEDE
jgi:signal peptidase II